MPMQTLSDRTLTAANSILMIKFKGLQNHPVKVEGYQADNAFEFGEAAIGETVVGVDGKQSGGYTPHEVDFNIHLLATTPSRDLFEMARAKMNTEMETFPVEIFVELPAIKARVHATGFMVSASGGSSAKRLLEGSTYGFKLVINSQESI